MMCAPRRASAYCLSTTCEGIDACDGAAIEGCPTLQWRSGCVGFSVQESGGSGLDLDTVSTIVDLAFEAWRDVDCGGAGPGLVILNLGPVPCERVEYNKDAGNANVILFNSEWAHSEQSHTFALTTTTFDPETGELLNADIELNSRDHDFTVNDEQIQTDLLSVLTHEIGHFLGLAHSGNVDATMFEFYEDGTYELRSLTADDGAALCASYPSNDQLTDACNPLPRHGFSPSCRDDQAEGSCSAGRPEPEGTGSWAWLVGALALSSARQRHSWTAQRPKRTAVPVRKPLSVRPSSRSIATRSTGRNAKPICGNANHG